MSSPEIPKFRTRSFEELKQPVKTGKPGVMKMPGPPLQSSSDAQGSPKLGAKSLGPQSGASPKAAASSSNQNPKQDTETPD